MASLRKRLKSDNWVCCYATADGRRTQRSTGTTDKDEAMAICRRWENEEYALRENGEPTEGLAVANKRALVAGLVSIVVVILGLVGYWQYDRWKNGPELFVDVPENEQPATFFESNFAKRHRWVRLSPDALERLNTLGGKIRLNLFDDLKVNTEVVVRRFIDGGAETSVGWLDDDPDTMMLMCRQTAQPGKLMGVVVDTLGTQYLISHEIDGKHVIVEVDQTKIPGCGGVVEMGPAKQTVKTAAARPASSTRDPAEAQALQRRMRGTVAQAFIGTGGAGGHEHGTGVACTECRSLATLKNQFKQAKQMNWNRPERAIQPENTGPMGHPADSSNPSNPSDPSETSGEPVHTSSHDLLKSMSFNQPLLAAINPSNKSWGLWGRGGSSRQTVGPTSPGVLQHLRGGDVEIIDVLFVYTDDLRAAQAGADAAEQLANLKISITRTVELTNAIFSNCHIPLEVRVADITLARWRAMSGGDATLAACGGPSGAAWEQVQAPVRPVFDSAAQPPTWTKHWNNGAKVGVYLPKYEMYNPSKLTPPGELGDALSWIGQNNNSLLYGDQYWGLGTFAAAAGNVDRAHINLPSNLSWILVPDQDVSPTTADNAVMFTYTTRLTPELNTGPVEHPESSHGLTEDYGATGNPASTVPTGYPGISHIPVQQYNDMTGPNPGPVLIDTVNDTVEWLGGVEHGLSTGSVIYFESWSTAPDTKSKAIPAWRVRQQPAKLTAVEVQSDGGGASSGPGGAGRRPQPQPGGAGKGAPSGPGAPEEKVGKGIPVMHYPVVAGWNGVITRAQHYPSLKIGERSTHPMFEAGRASYWYLDYPGNSAEPEKSARAFLGAMSGQLKMKPDTSDLKTLQVKHGLGTGHTRFQQVIHGIPVYGGHVSVHQRPNGAVHALHTRYHHDLSVDAQAQPAVSLTSAKAAAYRKAGVTRPRLPGSGKLVWWPDEHGGAKLAWEVTVCALKPLGDFHTVVDAKTGRVLRQENSICFATGSGNVFIPNPYQVKGGNADGTLRDNPLGVDDNNSTELDGFMTNTSLPRLLNGTGVLVGTYADLIRHNNGANPPVVTANESTRVYNYSRNDVRFEQTNVYYTLDRVGDYIKSLGFSSSNVPPNGIRDANATQCCAQFDGSMNAWFSPTANNLSFGTGGIDSAEDSDVVAHEYGHAITYDQNINWGNTGEFRAMGEGFGDYLAVTTFFNDGQALYQTYHAAVVGEWFGMGFDTFDNSPDVSKGEIKTILGGVIGNFIDDNSSAMSTDVEIRSVADFVIEPTNWQKLYFTDNNGSRVRRMDFNATFGTTVDVNSSFTLLAGGGAQNPDANASAANVALQQSLGTLGAMDLNSTEGVYFVDQNATGSSRIRRIDTNGSLTTVGGGGAGNPNVIPNELGAGSPLATTLNFAGIDDIAFDDQNRLYLSSTGSQRIWRMESNGTTILFAGGGTSELENQPATSTRLGVTHTLATQTITPFFFTQRFLYLDTNTTANGVRRRGSLVGVKSTDRPQSTRL